MISEKVPDRLVDVAEVIDRAPVGRYQIRIVGICGLIALLDGFDIQSMGVVLPSLAKDWSMPAAELGPLLSAGFLGIIIGMLTLGTLGDRYGRRTMLLVSFALVGIFSVSAALCASPGLMMAARFLVGLGIGGCLPNATALTTEYVPSNRVALFVSLMYAAVPLGGLVAGLLSGYLLQRFGWPSVFLTGGLLPLLLCVLIAVLLPESPAFLAGRDPHDPRIGAILQQIDTGYHPQPTDRFLSAAGQDSGRAQLRDVIADGRLVPTLLLCMIFFFSLAGLYLLTSWLPTLLTQRGWLLGQATLSISWFWLGGIVGGITGGALIDRYGAYRVLVPGFLLAALFTALIGLVIATPAVTLLIVLLAGFGVVGTQLAVTALAATIYPARVRSTGLGWGLGLGRFGPVLSPLVGGLLIAAGWTQAALLTAAAVPALICAGATLFLAIVEKRRRPG